MAADVLSEILEPLTPQECNAVVYLARYLATKKVAAAMGISIRTASEHLQSAATKLGVSRGRLIQIITPHVLSRDELLAGVRKRPASSAKARRHFVVTCAPVDREILACGQPRYLWTPEHDAEIILRTSEGWTREALAHALGVGVMALRKQLKRCSANAASGYVGRRRVAVLSDDR